MGRKTLSAFSIRGNYYIVPLKCVYRQWFLVRGLVDGSGQHTFLQESLKAGVCVPFVVAIRLNMLAQTNLTTSPQRKVYYSRISPLLFSGSPYV